METKHFRDVVKKLVDEPFFMIENGLPEPTQPYTNLTPNNYNIPFLNITSPITYRSINEEIQLYANQTIEQNIDELKEKRDSAIQRRERKNKDLFIETIEYWIAFTFLTFLLYLLHCKYQELVRLSELRNSIVSVRSYDVEMTEYTRYRKNSETQETLEETNTCKNYDIWKKIGHYFLFATCIIGFQYFFFENIVLSYDPLSIDEVKYIIYNKLFSNEQ